TPSRMALGMNSHALAAPCWMRVAKSGITKASQILGDVLELIDRPPLVARQAADRRLEAMVEMVLDQGAFRLRDRFFDRVQLLRDVEAGLLAVDHGDHGRKMPRRALEALGDVGVMRVQVGHEHVLSRGRGSCNTASSLPKSDAPTRSHLYFEISRNTV